MDGPLPSLCMTNMSVPVNQGGTQARIPIYPRSVKGRFRRLKWAILVIAYGTYFMLPWLQWERSGAASQALLFDITSRRFYLFDLVVHPSEIFWLAGFLVIAALLLFFVTGIAGRVFCGYFCFQTLWTDVFIKIERLVQGERPARIRLDKSGWTADKLFKKGLTHVLWLSVALLTGITFVLYWGYAPELVVQLFTGQAPFAAYATTLFLTATTYVMAGLAREQVCTYMCPYARFQSAMFDKDTLIVAYDRQRGESQLGRNKLVKGLKQQQQRHQAGYGDCVDCGFCVQVCPTGIDIRDGLQIQCISCALCIDACDNIMDSLGWPRGLIKYDSERHQEGSKPRLFKAKNIGYAVTLLLATVLLVWSVITSSTLDVAVQQVRQPLYVVLSDGQIQNSYMLKLNNKQKVPLSLDISVQGLDDAVLDLGRVRHIEIGADQSLQVRLRVRMPRDTGQTQIPFAFVIDADGVEQPLSVPAFFSMPR